MSKRRIVTAREQFELLGPWYRAADKNEALISNWRDTMMPPSQKKESEPGFKLPRRSERPPADIACPNCKGVGRKDWHICNNCFGSGIPVEDTNYNSAYDLLNEWATESSQKKLSEPDHAKPWGQKLEKQLYKEFMNWWPNSNAAQYRSPETARTNWEDNPREPITHWLNVEDFFQDNYPEAATGGRFGIEDAGTALALGQHGINGKMPTPEDLERYGYVGTGNVMTQAMLNLHNKMQGRSWASDSDHRSYLDMMLKAIGPNGKALTPEQQQQIRRTSARFLVSVPVDTGPEDDLGRPGGANDLLSQWDQVGHEAFGDEVPQVYGKICPTCNGKGFERRCGDCGMKGRLFSEDLTPQESNIKDTVKPWGERLEKQLYKEFMDWWPTSEAARTRTPETTTGNWMNYPHEPITAWLNVEDFLNERYPEAATGARFGLENAKPLLDKVIEHREMSPEELKEHGYTGHGNIITQAFLNLHNKLQGRFMDDKREQRKFLEFMLQHIGPRGRLGKKRTANAMDFFDWCAKEHLAPNRAALDLYSQVTNVSLEEYQDIARLLKGMNLNDGQLEILRSASRRFWAMPAPAPEGLTFKHEPETANARGLGRVNAYLDDEPVGHLEWLDDNNHVTLVTPRKPGEVSHIYVNHPYRRNSIATEMFDWTKKNVRPDLHHSLRRSELGDKWVNYEQSRQPVTARRFWAMPAPLPEGITFHYHPHKIPREVRAQSQYGYHFDAPALEARLGDKHVGFIHWQPEGPNQGEVNMIAVNPEFRRQSVASELFDVAKANHEPWLHHSENRTELGNKWVDYEQSRHPVMARRFWSMAWQDWAPKVDWHGCKGGCRPGEGGEYSISHNNGGYSYLHYLHHADDDGNPFIGVHLLSTDNQHRNDGVAESLIRQLHEDHPNHPIDPGFMLPDGKAFYRRMIEKEPEAINSIYNPHLVKAQRFWSAS